MSLREKYEFNLISNENNVLEFKLKNSTTTAKIMILEKNMFRVLITKEDVPSIKNTWQVALKQKNIPFEGINRLDITSYSKPKYDVIINEETCIIQTELLSVHVKLNGFNLTWYYKEKEIAKDRYTQAYNFENALGSNTVHYLTRSNEELYYGLGEKTGNLIRNENRYRMLSVDPMGYNPKTTDPLYKMIPFYITYNQKNKINFGLFYDTMNKSVFDLGHEYDNYHGPYRYFETTGNDLDYYLIANENIIDTVKEYTQLTGETIFQPKWSLGYSGSTMTYTDLDKSQERLNEFLDNCEENEVLCDSFQLSSGYTSIGNKRYVFNWNYDKFPDPLKFSTDFHKRNVKLCANIKPCLLIDHPQFKNLEKQGLFIKAKDNKNPEMAMFWDEIGAYIDFTNPKAIKWWQENVTKQLLEYGIDSTWNDNNEYEIHSETAILNGFGTNENFENMRSIMPLLMMKASYEAQKEYNPNIRPYLISRSGCPGMQRYVQTWTGDNITTWDSLKYNIKTGLGLSLSGIYNFGHDVGGFAGAAPSEELFIRWVQNGIFHPRFTIHSWNSDQSVNVPWMYKNSAKTISDLIKFRNYLLPYFYTELYKSHKSYLPILRPTFLNYENDANTFLENDDFMIGENLLICNVVKENETTREVYLPNEKNGWIEYQTKKYYLPQQTVTISNKLDEINFFVKAGTILPVNNAKVNFITKNKDARGIEIFAFENKGKSTYQIFEDDGISSDFENNHSIININLECRENIHIDFTIEGNYELPFNEITFYVNNTKNREIIINKEVKKNNAIIKIKE